MKITTPLADTRPMWRVQLLPAAALAAARDTQWDTGRPAVRAVPRLVRGSPRARAKGLKVLEVEASGRGVASWQRRSTSFSSPAWPFARNLISPRPHPPPRMAPRPTPPCAAEPLRFYRQSRVSGANLSAAVSKLLIPGDMPGRPAAGRPGWPGWPGPSGPRAAGARASLHQLASSAGLGGRRHCAVRRCAAHCGLRGLRGLRGSALMCRCWMQSPSLDPLRGAVSEVPPRPRGGSLPLRHEAVTSALRSSPRLSGLGGLGLRRAPRAPPSLLLLQL